MSTAGTELTLRSNEADLVQAISTLIEAWKGQNRATVDEFVPHANPVEVGARIRTLRKARCGVADFAFVLGISAKTLYRYEAGEHSPDAKVIAAICRASGVTADWLLFGRGTGPASPSSSATGTEG